MPGSRLPVYVSYRVFLCRSMTSFLPVSIQLQYGLQHLHWSSKYSFHYSPPRIWNPLTGKYTGLCSSLGPYVRLLVSDSTKWSERSETIHAVLFEYRSYRLRRVSSSEAWVGETLEPVKWPSSGVYLHVLLRLYNKAKEPPGKRCHLRSSCCGLYSMEYSEYDSKYPKVHTIGPAEGHKPKKNERGPL